MSPSIYYTFEEVKSSLFAKAYDGIAKMTKSFPFSFMDQEYQGMKKNVKLTCHAKHRAKWGEWIGNEVEIRGWTRLVAACLYPVERDLIVRTRSEKVDKIRKLILEFLLAHAPYSPQLLDLAQEYGADRDRFEKESSFCILCGLCVRYCAEVKKRHAVGFVDCGARREIRFIPEIALKECHTCKECFALCPTSFLQAAFVLTESLSPTSPT